MATRVEREVDREFGRGLRYEQVKRLPWREADRILAASAPKPTLPKLRCLEQET